MEVTNFSDYREYLKAELTERAQHNPAYSLRAFSRDLGLSAQTISSILRKQKGLSLESAALVAERLKLDSVQSGFLFDLVQLAHVKNKKVQQIISERLSRQTESNSFRNFDLEVFKLISDWHHIAILELIQTQDFPRYSKDTNAWIAARLGIGLIEASEAVERMLQLEVLEEKDGRLVKTNLNLTTSVNVPNTAIRKFQAQILQKALDSIEKQNTTERDLASITMAIDPSLLPEAQKKIQQFRRELCEFLEQGKQTEVYTLATSLFKLTKQNHSSKGATT